MKRSKSSFGFERTERAEEDADDEDDESARSALKAPNDGDTPDARGPTPEPLLLRLLVRECAPASFAAESLEETAVLVVERGLLAAPRAVAEATARRAAMDASNSRCCCLSEPGVAVAAVARLGRVVAAL